MVIKELTTGRLGTFLWFHWCFNISLDEYQLVVNAPFCKKRIPIARIKRLESIKGFMQPKYLKITYEDNDRNIKDLRFFSVNPYIWFSELQKLGIETEDGEGLRNVENYKFLQFTKILNLSAGVIGAVAAVVALIIVLFVFITGKFS